MEQARAAIIAANSPFIPPPRLLEDITGVRGVHVKADGEQASDLAAAAATKALDMAGTGIGEIDLLLFASSGQDLVEPATAHIVAAKLGAFCPVFDVKNACNSVLNALETTAAFIETRRYRTVLIACGETATLTARWHVPDHETFMRHLPGYTVSDAGAALLLTAGPAGPDDPGVLHTTFASDSSAWEACTIAAGGSLHPRSTDDDHVCLRLNEDQLTRSGRRMVGLVMEHARAEMALVRDSAFVAVHQISMPQFHEACATLGLPESRFMATVDRYGNAASASLPLQLALAQQGDRVMPGDMVSLIGLASGFSMGIAVIRM
ncbi:3-oxoacyl-ACP synthase III family protein [Streptomyces roseoverticillatus]|uniref:3-oxoacyl-ACP synthase III family protein n=1 Tax=Streptomyces roseoverticillatus TaxID=66429 RepID=UPI000998B294|nr:3-oxoacyl-[acyl-carrier-protein] synthase III C-terminal domain-containing protein [Streptomyces roseoverticillatus]